MAARSGCGRMSATHEVTDVDSVPTQCRQLLQGAICVLGRRCNASALSCADQLLTLTLTSENGYKFHTNGQTGSALGTQRLMVEESQRIIIAQHQETLRIDSER